MGKLTWRCTARDQDHSIELWTLSGFRCIFYAHGHSRRGRKGKWPWLFTTTANSSASTRTLRSLKLQVWTIQKHFEHRKSVKRSQRWMFIAHRCAHGDDWAAVSKLQFLGHGLVQGQLALTLHNCRSRQIYKKNHPAVSEMSLLQT